MRDIGEDAFTASAASGVSFMTHGPPTLVGLEFGSGNAPSAAVTWVSVEMVGAPELAADPALAIVAAVTYTREGPPSYATNPAIFGVDCNADADGPCAVKVKAAMR